MIHSRELSATYGTTKYCAYFLKNSKCPKSECLYLHKLGPPEDTLTRDGTAQLKLAKSNLLQTYNIEIDPPELSGTVFPSARIIRTRNFSEDIFRLPTRIQRRLSLAIPDRTQSRFEFVQAHSEECPVEIPPHISRIVNLSNSEVPVDYISMLLAPNSPDSWIGELCDDQFVENVRRLSMDDDSTIHLR